MLSMRLFKKHQRAAVWLAVILALFSATGALATAGALDPTFGDGGIVTTDFTGWEETIESIALQPDGKIVAAGWSKPIGIEGDFSLARYNRDGSLDETFGSGGKVVTQLSVYSDFAKAVAIQTDGKIVMGGYSMTGYAGNATFALVRYNPNGSLDTIFGASGKVIDTFAGANAYIYAIAIQPNGKIIVAGTAIIPGDGPYYRFALARYNYNGSPDLSFGAQGKVATGFGGDDPNGDAKGHAIALQPDGKIIVAGESYNFNANFALARYNQDGSLDTTFGNAGKVTTQVSTENDEAQAVIVQPNGKIVVTGYHGLGSGTGEFVLTRYNANGSLDTSFGRQGIVTTAFEGGEALGWAAVLQPNGKIIVGGALYDAEYLPIGIALARYNNDGSLDETFDLDGKLITQLGDNGGVGKAIALQRNGQIVAAGSAAGRFALVRYIGDCVTRTFKSTGSYDGWVLESGETSGAGGQVEASATTFLLGDDALKRQYRAVLSFDLKDLPQNAIINSAILKIKQDGYPVGSNPFASLGNVLVDVQKGPLGGAYRLTVKDFNAPATATKVAIFKNNPVSGWYSAVLNLAGKKSLNKGGIAQFRLSFARDDNNNLAADYLAFASSDNAAPGTRPQLIITYTLP